MSNEWGPARTDVHNKKIKKDKQRKRKMTEAEARIALEDYLFSLHTTLWLDWDIVKGDQRRKAIDYHINLWKNIGLIHTESSE